MLRLRLQSSGCCRSFVFERNVVNKLRNGNSLVCAWIMNWERQVTTSHYKWRSGQDGRAAGLNKSQAEMAVLSQERDADVGWREK